MSVESAMRKMLLTSKVVGLYGDPDCGKTFLMMVFAWWMLRFPGNNYVLSNVPLVRWTGEREVEAKLDRYIVCDTFADLFFIISEILVKDRDARFVVLMDEAGAKFGKASWSATLSIVLRTALTLVRKFNLVLMYAAVSEDILLKDLREDPALVQVRIYKGGFMLQKHAPDLLEYVGRDEKKAAIIHWPVKGLFYDPIIVSAKDQLAVPVEEARKTGAVYYDTKGLSDWSLSTHPVSGRPFSIEEMLTAVKGIGYDVPQKLYDYMHHGTPRPDDLEDEPPEAPARRTRPDDLDSPHGPSTKKGVQDEVDRMLIAGYRVKQIVAELDCSERFAYKRKATLRAEGKIA